MNDVKSDYRFSHMASGKGRSYNRQFSDQPYRSLVWEYERGVLDRILSEPKLKAPFRLLDFACGTGRVLKYLAPRAAVLVGVDLSPSMLEVAREMVPGAEIIEADLTREDLLGERVFDLITAFRFFPNAQKELREEAMEVIVRHLSPGGVLVFNNHKNTASLRNRLARMVGRRAFKGISPEETIRLVSSRGIVIKDIFHFGVLPATESRSLLPYSLLRRIEFSLSRVSILKTLGQNLIYVCQNQNSRCTHG